MRRHLIALGILAVAGWTANGALTVTAAERRAITEKDLFAFVWVADPQISPDGSRVAFVRVTADEKKDQYDTAIWIAPTDGSEPPRAFTGGQRDTSPRWSPDGRHLAFARAPEKDGRPQPPQLYLISMGGGEPRAVTDLPQGAANPVWSPDGKTIAFSSSTRPDELTPKPVAKPEETPHQSDVRVITQAVYRANGVAGSGFVDSDRPGQIWTVAVPASGAPLAAPKRVTSGEFGASNHRWSTDGTRILFVSDRRRESYYYANDSDLYEVPKDGGEPARIVSIEGTIGAYRPVTGRQAARVRRHPPRRTRTLVQPGRSLGRRSSRRHAAQPDRDLRLRRQRQRRRRPARAARPVPGRTSLDARRTQHHRQGRRAGERQPGAG